VRLYKYEFSVFLATAARINAGKDVGAAPPTPQ
jgi:hypothetical protein